MGGEAGEDLWKQGGQSLTFAWKMHCLVYVYVNMFARNGALHRWGQLEFTTPSRGNYFYSNFQMNKLTLGKFEELL